MNAGEAVQAAMLAGLRGDAALAGVAVSESGAASAALPRIEVGQSPAIDWSAKSMRGRELRTAATVRVAEGQRGRLGALTAAAERVGETLSGDIGGWRVVGAVFVRSLGVDETNGVRAVLIEHRVRVVES